MIDNYKIIRFYSSIIELTKAFFTTKQFSEILPAFQSPDFEFSEAKSCFVGEINQPDIHLPASHSFHKQIACQYLNKVFTIAPCYRNENIGRLSGKMFYQIEVELIENSIFKTQELIREFFTYLEKELFAGKQLNTNYKFVFTDFDSINLPEQFKVLNVKEFDIWSNKLSESIVKPTWLNYTPQTPKPKLNKSYQSSFSTGFDLILPMGYGEVLSGGLRDKEQLRKFFKNKEFIDTSVDSCGFGIGLDRLINFFLQTHSISEVQLPYNLC